MEARLKAQRWLLRLPSSWLADDTIIEFAHPVSHGEACEAARLLIAQHYFGSPRDLQLPVGSVVAPIIDAR